MGSLQLTLNNIIIKILDKNKYNDELDKYIERLANVYADSEPERYQDFEDFWSDWFNDKILGNKITIIAIHNEETVGTARFWQSPYCNNKWLIEGLEVIETYRKKGIGKSIVNYGINELIKNNIDKVYSHIKNNNAPSIALHKGLGFKANCSGYIDSFGTYREYGKEYVLALNKRGQQENGENNRIRK